MADDSARVRACDSEARLFLTGLCCAPTGTRRSKRLQSASCRAPEVRGAVIAIVRMLVSLRSQKMYVGDVKYTCGSVRQHIYRFSPLNCQYFGGARPPVLARS